MVMRLKVKSFLGVVVPWWQKLSIYKKQKHSQDDIIILTMLQ